MAENHVLKDHEKKTSKGFTHVKSEGKTVANVEFPTQTAIEAVMAKLSIIAGLRETQTQPMFASGFTS